MVILLMLAILLGFIQLVSGSSTALAKLVVVTPQPGLVRVSIRRRRSTGRRRPRDGLCILAPRVCL